MMDIYRVFTAADGVVSPGATGRQFRLKGADVIIPAILIGEEGRGRELGVLPVAGDFIRRDCPERGSMHVPRDACWRCAAPTVREEYEERGLRHCRFYHPRDEGWIPVVQAASIGQTRAGKPKLICAAEPNTDKAAIIVLRTPIGYRGHNEHHGDFRGHRCSSYSCGWQDASWEKPERCPKCNDRWSICPDWEEFPGQILCSGRIAQGDAGRMGNGDQYVALIPKGRVFTTVYTGRRYGSPSMHFYMFDGEKVLVATKQERLVSDCF